MTNQILDTHDISIVTTAIPYVNAPPHLGHALETVITDAIARYRRQQGSRVHHQSGTDDHALKNAQAAAERGRDTREFVEQHAGEFRALGLQLDASWDTFVSTSSHPRHRAIVEELWNRCCARGDIYRAAYRGLYCLGCEQFYEPAELVEGKCPEHDRKPEVVEEQNYFFRLSRYRESLERLILENRLRIAPPERRAEVLAFISTGLRDFSISRSRDRARDWGIPVPGDPTQVIYVWFDALANYISGLGTSLVQESLCVWQAASRIEHVIGKGILRFHAVYWPALLLSAGLRLPTDIRVHGYLTVEGKKIGKSSGNAIEVANLVQCFGIDPIRYYLLRHIRTTRDGDFSRERLIIANDHELADQLGNLVQRTTSLIQRYREGRVPPLRSTGPLEEELTAQIQVTLDNSARGIQGFALHEGLDSIWHLIALVNRYVECTKPWELGRRDCERGVSAQLDTILYTLADAVVHIAEVLASYLPRASSEILRRLGASATPGPGSASTRLVPGTRIHVGAPLFVKRGAKRQPLPCRHEASPVD